jgi:hypothetical protein
MGSMSVASPSHVPLPSFPARPAPGRPTGARGGAVALLAALLACASLGASPTARAQTAVKPYFLLIVDSSGSMAIETTCGSGTTNTCGRPCTRINDAKCAVQRVVNATGDVTWGLAQFAQQCRGSCADLYNSSTGQLVCNATQDSGVIRVGIAEGNESALLSWVDWVCGVTSAAMCPTTASANHNEIYAGGNTPLGGSLERARCYFRGTCGDTTPASPLLTDPALACRPVSVILLTDGLETCGGNAPAAAMALRTTSLTLPGGMTVTKDIRTYVIGFGVAAGNANIENIAIAGGTDAPGPHRAFYPTDEAGLSLALSQIVAESVLNEVCNNADDNCNALIDEGLPKYCNTGFGVAAPDCSNTAVNRPACTLCAPPAETHCDGIDNNCDGRIDEGLRNACGTCGPAPMEICDGVDNDCDGAIDEGGVCGSCTPSPEICDGVDNDCDGLIDEMLTRPCGRAVGRCTVGVETCTAGRWGGCTAVGPTDEVCNGIDDDCNGVIDGLTRPCGSSVGACRAGTQICTAGTWSSMCLGEVGPSAEVCDGVDNDCDGSVDESDPMLDRPCGESTPPCIPGRLSCVGGSLMCTGAVGPTEEICDGIDNDCDGAIDDGLGVGAPCGTSVGECRPGTLVCAGGMIRCEGEVGPIAETCNALDDDCNGVVDDVGGGGACGTDVGLCRPGMLMCVGGREVCAGSVGPAPEVCDCEDNDCDGSTDEESASGSLCPPGSSCVECSCSLPCERTEFGTLCPTGRTPFERPDGTCFCVRPRCEASACAAETVTGPDGATLCAPDDASAPPCVCKNNRCTFACEGVTCSDGLVCNPRTGACVTPTCATLGCPRGRYCDAVTGECEVDRCEGVSCGAGEACRSGACEPSCAGVTCGSGRVCRSGVCVDDRCAGVRCGRGEACDPSSGTCVEDVCARLTCPTGAVCDLAAGRCVTDPCATLRCPSGERCDRGECARGAPSTPDGGTTFDGGTRPEPTRLLATGGGGCVCTAAGLAAGGRGADGGGSGAAGGSAAAGGALLASALAGLAVASRRRRAKRGRRTPDDAAGAREVR